MKYELDYHYHAKKGWINDPNGLCYFKGKYHLFYQYNPYDVKWDTMHWGHAVSEDLIHWEELPIALYPDMPYESSDGCFSGSAIIHNDEMWLFYTSVSEELGQTQSLVISKDGYTFEKYPGNPIIKNVPEDGTQKDFRDPKVFEHDGHFYMVTGTCKGELARVLLFRSDDLLNWEYRGILYESDEFLPVIECPDLFPVGDKWVLAFSIMRRPEKSVALAIGDFKDEKFILEEISFLDRGPESYAPQSFLAPDGRRILIEWMNNWKFKRMPHDTFAGAFTVPREIFFNERNRLCLFPVREARHLLVKEDKDVVVAPDSVTVTAGKEPVVFEGKVDSVDILRDNECVEVFINGGEEVITVYELWGKCW